LVIRKSLGFQELMNKRRRTEAASKKLVKWPGQILSSTDFRRVCCRDLALNNKATTSLCGSLATSSEFLLPAY